MTNIVLQPCPFCGMTPPDDLSDTLYPSGIVWTDHEQGFRSYSSFKDNPTGDRCYSMNCTTNLGGCGAEVHGDSKDEAIAAWNRREAAPLVTTLTYTVDGEVMSPLEYIAYLHGQLDQKIKELEVIKQEDGWISVDEALPIPWGGRLFSEEVQAVNMDSDYPCVILTSLNFEVNNGKIEPTVWSNMFVTHWQPKPKLPDRK